MTGWPCSVGLPVQCYISLVQSYQSIPYIHAMFAGLLAIASLVFSLTSLYRVVFCVRAIMKAHPEFGLMKALVHDIGDDMPALAELETISPGVYHQILYHESFTFHPWGLAAFIPGTVRRLGIFAKPEKTKETEKPEQPKTSKKTEEPEQSETSVATEEAAVPEEQKAPEAPKVLEEEKKYRYVDNAAPLFELVEKTLNNNRARLQEAANDLVGFLNKKEHPGKEEGKICKDKQAYCYRPYEKPLLVRFLAHSRNTLKTTENADMVPEEVMESYAYIKKNFARLESDAFVASVIILARKAKREGRNLVLGVETDWVPGMDKRSLQRDLINPFLSELRTMDDKLKSMGLDNVVIVHKNKEEIIDAVKKEMGDEQDDLSNLVMFASEDVLANFMRKTHLDRIKDPKKRPFLAAVDPSLVQKHHNETGDLGDHYSVQMLEMLLLTLELAYGIGNVDVDKVPFVEEYNPSARFVQYLPRAEVLTEKNT